jgi:hypothetical protein
MQLKDPPQIKMQQYATTSYYSDLLEIHATTTLQHATTLSTASQLKDDDYNSCVEWTVAATSADGEYDSDIKGDSGHHDSDVLQKSASKSNMGIGGAFSSTKEAFRILKRIMARHEILSSLKSVCVPLSTLAKDDEDDYKDNKLFQDDTTEENLEEDMAYYQVNTTVRQRRTLSNDGPPRPDSSGMTEAKAQELIREWRVFCKAHTDKMQREHKKLFGSDASTEIEYSGVLDDRIWLMSDVEVTPWLKGRTFPTKEIVLIQIAEEANFCGCQIVIVRSDNYQVHVQGCVGSLFKIKAFCSLKIGWKVNTQTMEVANADDDFRRRH